MEVFLQTLIQIARLFVYAGIGAVFNKCKIMPEAFKTVASRMVTKLLLPMLIMNTFIRNCNVRNLTENIELLMYGGILFFAVVIIATLSTKAMHIGDPYERNVVRYAQIFPNTGSFNTPLTLAFLGSIGLFYSSLFTFAP